MTNKEILALVESLVQTFGTAEAALKAIHDAPIPRKKRYAKKQLLKWVRTYIYFINHHRGEYNT